MIKIELYENAVGEFCLNIIDTEGRTNTHYAHEDIKDAKMTSTVGLLKFAYNKAKAVHLSVIKKS